jgi:hypothetical protein
VTALLNGAAAGTGGAISNLINFDARNVVGLGDNSTAGGEVFNCGTTSTCAGTVLGHPHTVIGSVPLISGTLTQTLTPPFTATTSYRCIVTDEATTATVAGYQRTSASSITLKGTGTDTISYVCVGN